MPQLLTIRKTAIIPIMKLKTFTIIFATALISIGSISCTSSEDSAALEKRVSALEMNGSPSLTESQSAALEQRISALELEVAPADSLSHSDVLVQRIATLEAWQESISTRLATLEATKAGATILADDSGKETEAEIVVRQYLSCTTWEERLNYCWEPKSLVEKMKARYGNVNLKNVEFELIEELDLSDLRYSNIGIKAVNVDNRLTFFLRTTEADLQIDWEASLAICEKDIRSLTTDSIPTATLLRCYVDKSVFFHGGYRGKKDSFDSYQIYDSAGAPIIYGFMSKTAASSGKLREICAKKPGQLVPVIIKVATKALDEEGRHISIVEFIQEGWLLGALL